MGGAESKQQEQGPDQKEETERQSGSTALKAVCVAAGAVTAGAALLWGLSSIGGGENDEAEEHGESSKLMKAPGRNGELIERERFEEDAKGYFRQLRGKDK